MADQHSRYLVLASAVAANFGQFGARVAISPFVIAIATQFGRTKADIGLVLTLMWAVYALLQFPGGIFADRYGERRIVLLALGLATLGGVLVAASPNFWAFALAALVLGSGAGLYFAAGTSLLDQRFVNTGQAFGIHSAGGPLAGLVVPVAASAVAASYDWRAGILVGAAGAALAFGLAGLAIGSTPASTPDATVRDRLSLATVIDLLSRPAVAFTTVLGVVGMYVFQSFVSFFPTFLQEYHNLSRGRASFLTGLAFVLIAVGLPVVGHLADTYGHDYGLAIPFLVTGGGFAVLLGAGGSGPLLAGVIVVGAGMTWGGALQSRFMPEFGADERGTGFGLVRSAFVLLGSVGNAATGILAEFGGWELAYGLVVALLVGAAALVVGNRLLGLGL